MGFHRLVLVCCVVGLILPAGHAVAGPVPVLQYWFDDVASSTVPNHGVLGIAGDATVASGTTFGQPTGWPSDPVFLGGTMIVDNSADRVYTADHDVIDSLDAFTLAFWVNPSTLGTWQELLGDCDPLPTNGIKGWNLQTGSSNASQLQLRLWDGAAIASLFSSAGSLVAGEWQHITLVAEGLTTPGTRTVSVAFYRDGEYLNTATASTDRQVANDSTGFTIGNAMWDQSLMAQYGAVTLFNGALTADQVEHHYLSTIPEPGTLAMLGLLAGLGLCSRRRARI